MPVRVLERHRWVSAQVEVVDPSSQVGRFIFGDKV